MSAMSNVQSQVLLRCWVDIFIIDILVMFPKFALKYQRNFPLSRRAHGSSGHFNMTM